MTTDARWEALLLDRAQAALAETGTPFVAFIVSDGEEVAAAHNEVSPRSDPTAHAELLAIQRGCALRGWRGLTGATLYTSCEPCLMCLGAALSANIAEVRYASSCETLGRLRPRFRHYGAAQLTAPLLPMTPLPSAPFDALFARWSDANPPRRPPRA